MGNKLDISIGSIIKIFLVILSIYFLYLIRDILALLFIAIVTVSAIEPVVNYLQIKKIPRSFGMLLIFLVIFSLIGTAIYFLIPPIEKQFADFSEGFPVYFENAQHSFQGVKNFFIDKHIAFDAQKFADNFSQEISGFTSNIFSKTIGVFSGVISFIVILSLTFYMGAQKDGMEKFITLVVPHKHREYAASLVARIKIKIGKWMQGQLFLMFLIFVLDFIGLYLVGVPYALILAIFAGIMEIIPYIGPIVSAIPGIFLGFLVSPTVGFLAILVYVIVQQFENHIITPQIMKKAVGLNPIAVILALLIGAKLGGVLGAILAIPMATAIGVFAGDIMRSKNKD